MSLAASAVGSVSVLPSGTLARKNESTLSLSRSYFRVRPLDVYRGPLNRIRVARVSSDHRSEASWEWIETLKLPDEHRAYSSGLAVTRRSYRFPITSWPRPAANFFRGQFHFSVIRDQSLTNERTSYNLHPPSPRR